MTPDPRSQRFGVRSGGLGPLGRRLFAAFAVVALASVALLTVAAFVGTDRGLSSAHQAERQRAADRVAAATADAYRTAGDWASADLSAARSLALGAGAVLTVRDADDKTVSSGSDSGSGSGSGSDSRSGSDSGAEGEHGMSGSGQGHHGQGMGSGPGASAPVAVDGRTVGSVQLAFSAGSGSAGRLVAWGWVAAAALGALALALAVSWFVTRRLTAPVVRVAAGARALAGGDRSARAGIDAPGELGDLARAFDAMADDVTHAERARHRLAADVAHELRTPLASLQAGLEELRDGYADPSAERLAALHDQALRLGRIVGDLGELADAESARLSLRLAEVDLTALARAAVTEREAELRGAGLTVHAVCGPAPLRIRADADRLHQALGNLLSNTARHCRPGDTVTVTTSATPTEALVEVADTGPGITADELPHVFDRLWRGAHARAGSGSGIGLAVVKELVTAHGGTVTADSGPGGGTRMTLHLPRAVTDEQLLVSGPGAKPRIAPRANTPRGI
ncbi:two-component system sensor histidine kinase BaeS [Streptomyces sp. SAI-208]|uniref:sensor histidine kinase n=1 Tax=Streptomyces sp. SAI-208 TaxID=2940550 RepID=UPI002475C34A|nr:HAMP domain-containing sensor histidine kinase [Streptomyces sp. SAI-208]MDH6612685.1 two-component system sensor histidine kinase BaeS [Streptomyces sp. SAI-208]